MVQQLTDVKQIRGNSGQKMSNLLVIVKRKRELLVMSKYLVAHIPLDPGSHNMTVIGNIIVTKCLHQHKGNHKNTQLHDQVCGLPHRLVHYCAGDIAYDQRNHQRDPRS